MPSLLHETLIEIFRAKPSLALDLLAGGGGIAVPAFDAIELLPGELQQPQAPQYRADAVISLTRAGKPVLAVIVEAQLAQDPLKLYSWPVYLAGVRALLLCPTLLVVVTPYRGVAKWAAAEIALGPNGGRMRPSVLGPDEIPLVTDAAVATKNLQLACLSAVAHPRGAQARTMAMAVVRAEWALGLDEWGQYTDCVLASMDPPDREAVEAEMKAGYEYQSDFARRYVAQGKAEGKAEGEAKGKAEGKAEGEAKAVLAVLAARGLAVSETERERILACRDLAELDRWIACAVAVTSAGELFEG